MTEHPTTAHATTAVATAPGRTATAAAVAGIIFSAIMIAVLVMFHLAVPAEAGTTDWAADPGRRQLVTRATELVPFAGISFLWFIGVVRTRLADREDKLFATVFLGSGLLYVAMLFVAAGAIGGLLMLLDRGVNVSADSVVALQVLTRQLTGTFGARMAAVFTMATTSVGMRAGIMSRWLVVTGYVAALLLLLTPPLPRWGQLVFPTWVLVVSLSILAASRRKPVRG